MTRRLLIAAVLAAFALVVWLSFFWTPISPSRQAGHASLELAAPPSGGDFELASVEGPVRLADLRGKVVLIYFGYTACPDVCPTNLAFIASALKGLSDAALERVQVLFISVDPERDDLERLKAYAAYFHPRIRGITGSADQVAQVASLYGAVYRRAPIADTAMGYLVDHSAYTYVVDPAGKLVDALDHATPPDKIRRTIHSLLGVPAESAQ